MHGVSAELGDQSLPRRWGEGAVEPVPGPAQSPPQGGLPGTSSASGAQLNARQVMRGRANSPADGRSRRDGLPETPSLPPHPPARARPPPPAPQMPKY